MLIQFYGASCARISTKIDNVEVSVLFDPYGPDTGKLPKNLSADIVAVSRPDDAVFGHTEAVKGEYFLIEHAGEYEVKGVPIYGIPSKNAVFYHFTMNGLRIAHLGGVSEPLDNEHLDKLGDVDILMLPVGGGACLGAKQAAELLSRVEPRAVIPMHFKMTGLKLKAEGFSDFIKETGLKTESMDKWKVQRKDLPDEETLLVVMDKA